MHGFTSSRSPGPGLWCTINLTGKTEGKRVPKNEDRVKKHNLLIYGAKTAQGHERGLGEMVTGMDFHIKRFQNKF